MNDYCKIAMNIPYSYSRLIYQMKICEQRAKEWGEGRDKGGKKKVERKGLGKGKLGDSGVSDKNIDINEELYWSHTPIGYSIANNAIPYITLTHMKNKP